MPRPLTLVRPVLLLAALLAVPVGVPPAQAVPAAQAPEQRAVTIRLLQANIGNINVAPGACNDQAVKLCLAPVERRLADRLAELRPQVVLFQEVLPGLVCEPPARPGAFGTPPTSASLLNPQHLCSPGQRAGQSDPDQVDRLLPPTEWESRCNAPFIDPADAERVIPPWDCISIRRELGRITAFRTCRQRPGRGRG
jgi:hypothetical protein